MAQRDDTQTRAELGIELTGRKARHTAQNENGCLIELPPGFSALGPDAERVAASERRLFEARRRAASGWKAQHRERIERLQQRSEGLSPQRTSKTRLSSSGRSLRA